MSEQGTQPPGALNPGQLAKYQRDVAAERRANADPLPGPLADAFTDQTIIVGPLRIRPLVASDMAMFKKLNAPFYREMLEQAKPEAERQPVEWTDEDSWESIFMMSRSPAEVRKAYSLGREKFREMAVQSIGDSVAPHIISRASEAVAQQIKSSFETAVKYAAEGKEGDESFFQDTTPAAKATA